MDSYYVEKVERKPVAYEIFIPLNVALKGPEVVKEYVQVLKDYENADNCVRDAKLAFHNAWHNFKSAKAEEVLEINDLEKRVNRILDLKTHVKTANVKLLEIAHKIKLLERKPVK